LQNLPSILPKKGLRYFWFHEVQTGGCVSWVSKGNYEDRKAKKNVFLLNNNMNVIVSTSTAAWATKEAGFALVSCCPCAPLATPLQPMSVPF
jgi:hypothetical protein